MHIGLNTGLVVAGGVGSGGRQHYSVMGDAVNLASGLKLSAMGFTARISRFFLPGGRRVGLTFFERLAAGEVEVLHNGERSGESGNIGALLRY